MGYEDVTSFHYDLLLFSILILKIFPILSNEWKRRMAKKYFKTKEKVHFLRNSNTY
jgi:hypothetical protein